MKYAYKARTKTGELQVGNVDADSRDAASNVLLGHGLFVLSVSEVKEGHAFERIQNLFRRVSTADLMIFTRQFATLLESQVPLSDALTNLYHQTRSAVLREAIAEVATDIDSGHPLSQALERQKGIFSDFYVNMIRSAEVTGRLAEVLHFMADYLENQAELVSKVRNAMFYPIFVICLFFAVIIIMVTFVLPQITPIFAEASIDLPLFTRFVIGAGGFVNEWWWAILIVLGLFCVAVYDYFQTDEGKVVRDELLLKIPILGSMFRKVYIARFAESAKVLIKGGLTIPQAIEISARTMGNTVYQEVLHRAADQVRRGRLLSQAFAEMPEIPPLVSQLVGVGESTGRLEALLDKVNLYYTREINNTVDNLVNLIQPALMVLIGIMVALLFASILMPLYNLSQSFA
ncbi:MAG: type II secretion system F family protein [Candidatus Wolfebacteria bacterium]|nr:type II secretion system F family protein [Candidatus Wolfebacteria bacterium]